MRGREYDEDMIIRHCNKRQVYVRFQMIPERGCLEIFLKDRSKLQGKELRYDLSVSDNPLAFTNELLMIMILDKLICQLKEETE